MYELLYAIRQPGTSKEVKEQWHLKAPSAAGLAAAEGRGLKIKDELESSRGLSARPLHKSKLAYAWSFKFKGSKEPRNYSVLHGGSIKSAGDAVKAILAKDYLQKGAPKLDFHHATRAG